MGRCPVLTALTLLPYRGHWLFERFSARIHLLTNHFDWPTFLGLVHLHFRFGSSSEHRCLSIFAPKPHTSNLYKEISQTILRRDAEGKILSSVIYLRTQTHSHILIFTPGLLSALVFFHLIYTPSSQSQLLVQHNIWLDIGFLVQWHISVVYLMPNSFL